MYLSTCWSRVEVGRLCQIFVAVKSNSKLPFEPVWEPVEAMRGLPKGNIMKFLPHLKKVYCNQTHQMVPVTWFCGEIFVVTQRVLLWTRNRHSMAIQSDFPLRQVQAKAGKNSVGTPFACVALSFSNLWVILFTYLPWKDKLSDLYTVGILEMLPNDVVCFWGQLWKKLLLAGICYLKIIAGVNKNARKLSHVGTLYEEVGRKKFSFRESIDGLVLNRY